MTCVMSLLCNGHSYSAVWLRCRFTPAQKNKYFRFPINLNDMMDTTFRERTMKEIKQTQLQIRITTHEKSKLKTIADNSNLSMSDYIRSLINQQFPLFPEASQLQDVQRR